MKYFAAIMLTVSLAACSAVKPSTTPLKSAAPQLISEANVASCGGDLLGASRSCSRETEYCHREIKDACGAADAPGICREKPQICTMDYSPVCGCDGMTYSNECAANSKGISAAYQGECTE